MTRARIAASILLLAVPARAQQSASHTLEEHVLNAGGHPYVAGNPVSASHRLTLGSIGDPFRMQRLLGATTILDGGFVITYPPPGEVTNLRFTDDVTLVWDTEPSAGRYHVYRDTLAALGALGYGACAHEGLTAPTTTDMLPVPPGTGLFFLVTVENRLGEEGTKGVDGSGVERLGTVCP
jgi:hypothetical protein